MIADENDVVVTRNGETIVVPEGHVWIEGDNAEVSLDSTHYGPVRFQFESNFGIYQVNSFSNWSLGRTTL